MRCLADSLCRVLAGLSAALLLGWLFLPGLDSSPPPAAAAPSHAPAAHAARERILLAPLEARRAPHPACAVEDDPKTDCADDPRRPGVTAVWPASAARLSPRSAASFAADPLARHAARAALYLLTARLRL